MDLLAVQHVALAEEIEHRAQFRTAFRGRAAALLCPDCVAPGRLQRRFLDGQVLFDGADLRVTDNCHISAPAESFNSGSALKGVSKPEYKYYRDSILRLTL